MVCAMPFLLPGQPTMAKANLPGTLHDHFPEAGRYFLSSKMNWKRLSTNIPMQTNA
jgi:hypothetical protein